MDVSRKLRAWKDHGLECKTDYGSSKEG
jgi:hypothetical protein